MSLLGADFARLLIRATKRVGVTKFDEMVSDGRMPRPKRIDGRTVWDRVRLDDAFDALDNEAAKSEWDRL
jgi:hypothetical protein